MPGITITQPSQLDVNGRNKIDCCFEFTLEHKNCNFMCLCHAIMFHHKIYKIFHFISIKFLGIRKFWSALFESPTTAV